MANGLIGERRARGAKLMRRTLTAILAAAAVMAATPLLSAEPKGDEPVAVPSNIKQGIDFVYVDPAMSTVAHRHQKPRNWLARLFTSDKKNAPNPWFEQISRGLEQYRATWGRLPQTKVSGGRRSSSARPASALPSCAAGWAWRPATASTRRCSSA